MINPHPGMKIVPCDMCGGSGLTMRFPSRGNPFAASSPYPVECSECLGEGTVEIEDEDYAGE